MDMKKKLLFVFNPCSGKAQIKNQLLDIVDTMVKADYEVTVYPTQCAGDAKEKVEAYAGNYDLVVCSGGDGTLDEVVTGMMQCKAKVPLGYIPAGSTNDFASSLGIPKDMEKAAEAAVTGKSFPCDVGLFNGDYFVYVAAFGLFTEVSYKTSQEWKNVLGHAAYILEGAKCLHFLIHIIQCVRKSPSTRACPTKALLDSGIILVPKVIKHDVAQCLVEITLNRIIELLPHVSIVVSELTGVLHIEHHQFCYRIFRRLQFLEVGQCLAAH